MDQLKQMFTGEITNWSEVGGDDGEIVLIGREAGSGTRDGFESIVDVKDSCKYAQELTATGAVISAVEANPLAIGYASLSAVGDTVKMVTVGRCGVQRGDRQGRQLRGAAPLRVRHQQVCHPV